MHPDEAGDHAGGAVEGRTLSGNYPSSRTPSTYPRVLLGGPPIKFVPFFGKDTDYSWTPPSTP